MLDFNPFEAARVSAMQNGGGGQRLNYLKMADGEKVVLRFLTGLTYYTVYSHSCGLNLYDIPTETVMKAQSAGQPVLCPSCGQPLTDNDVVYERKPVVVADMHTFTTAPNGQRGTFLCLNSHTNHEEGLITDEHYGECPVCAKNDRTGNIEHPTPRNRIVGLAVIRDVDYIQENRGGRPVQVYAGSHDQLGEDGKPRIVVVEQAMRTFWAPIYYALATGNDDYSRTICDYDWEVTRNGSGMETTYTVNVLNLSNPFPVDLRDYDVPDFTERLKSNGSIAHFEGNGYVFGQQPNSPNSQAAPAPARPQPQRQGGFGAPPIGGNVPWDNVRPS